jgi:hypothetical protein
VRKELICSLVLMLPFVSGCPSPLEQDEGLLQASSNDAASRQTANVAPGAGPEADIAAPPEPPPPTSIPFPPSDFF